MSRLRLHILVWGLFTPALGSIACSDDEQAAAPAAADASTDHDAGRSSSAGSGGRSGASGGGGTVPAGTGAVGGVDSGSGGTPIVGSDAGGAASGGGSGQGGMEGGSDASASVALTVCVRLQSPSVLAFDVTRTYDHTVYADCRVKWVANLYLDVDQREVFLNNLLAWNMRFWGCSPPPPTEFALIFKPAPLTSADAAALIDDYIDVSTQALGLSAPEIDQMRAALEKLSKSVVATVSNDYSKSQCATDAGADGASDASRDAGADASSRRDAARDAPSGS
jgi:hypothetical protein